MGALTAFPAADGDPVAGIQDRNYKGEYGDGYQHLQQRKALAGALPHDGAGPSNIEVRDTLRALPPSSQNTSTWTVNGCST